MSNSNGMYRVLDVFKKLEPVEQPTAKQQAQAIYESVEARGSILEGVGRVEKKLAEQFASFKEGEKVPVKGGMVHKGTYGNSYDGDEPAASDGPKKRGRPAKGTPKKVKPTGEKRGRGRPKKDTSTELKTKGGDIFGRTTGAIPKGKKGTVIKGKGNIDEKAVNPYAVGMAQAMKSTGDKPPLQKSTITKAHDIAKKVKTNESKIMESFNFSEMMKDTDMSVGEMLETIQNDIKTFKETGMCSDTLEAFLKIHNHGKKKLTDAAPVPYEVPAYQRKAQGVPPLTPGDVQQQDKNRSMHPGMTKLDAPKPAVAELDELARLAGITDTKTEGNAFTGKLAATKKGDSFELDGKTFTDNSNLDEETTDEGNAFGKAVRDAKKDGIQKGEKIKVGGKEYPVKEDVQIDECDMMSPIGSAAQSMEQQQGKISVSTNMSSDGNKNVSINADGEAADQLMQMLKMAGLGGGEAHAKLAIAVPADSGEEGVEEAAEQYANTPEEEYAGVDTITNQGDDMNRQKKQFADKPRQGDNPMATQPMAEEIDPIGTLGRDLMKEYQALKLQK